MRPYQHDAVQAVYEHLKSKDSNPCVVIPTAGGKSLCLAEVAKDAVVKWNGRVLILAHVKELVEQNAGKIKAIQPDLPVGIYSAGLESRDIEQPVIVAGIQSIYNKADLFKPFDLVMIDECFPAGTLVSTPRGDIPIEEVSVGTKVFNATGIGVVQCTSARMAHRLVQLELEDGSNIICTENHPIFADGKWCAAGALGIGSRLVRREDLPYVREGIPTADKALQGEAGSLRGRKELEQESPLFQRLCNAGETHPELGDKCLEEVRVLWEDFLSKILHDGRKNPSCGAKCLGRDSFLLDILRKTQGESCLGESLASKENQAARRKWPTVAESPAIDAGASERTGETGIFNSHNAESTAAGGSKLIQGGCGNPDVRFGGGIGWTKSQVALDTPEGCQEERNALGVRVVRVAHLEWSGGTPVYNLQVSGHPSYFAGGVLVHNCHLIPPDGEGRYQTFLNAAKKMNPNVRLIGWTATPYRTQGGLICKPENLLNEVCYEIGVKELINRGYISNITAKAGKFTPDTDGLHIRAGEFVAEDVEKLMGEDGLVNSACREIVELTKSRKACLIFCTSVAHCKKVADAIKRFSGEECAIVTGDTPADEREETIKRLRGETVKADLFSDKPPLKYCCNVSVLTTGTDIPRLDTIALLRPTNSPGLLVQMVGRGFRLSPETGKTECLVLDYGHNIERHGPIDMIKVKEPGQGGGGPLAKVCPQCQAIVNLPVMLCPECGYQWPRKEPERKSHEATAAKVGILSGEVTVEKFPVQRTSYQVWEKRGAPPDAPKTVRITYDVDYLTHYSEWLCPEHTGYARRKFEKWWREHAHPDCPMPNTADEVCEHDFAGMIREVKEITVRFVSGQKYPEITGYELGDFPLVQAGQDAQGEEVSDEDWDDISF